MSSLSLSTEGGQSWPPWFCGLEVYCPSLHLLWAGHVRTRSLCAPIISNQRLVLERG